MILSIVAKSLDWPDWFSEKFPKQEFIFLIRVKGLAKDGLIEIDQLNRRLQALSSSGHKLVIDWDLLMEEGRFHYCRRLIEQIDPSHLYGIRVSDPGAFQYLLEETQFKVELNLDHGNHNFSGFEKWSEFGGDRLLCIAPSMELTGEKIESYQAQLKVDLEPLLVGPILLFYSPRKLLSATFEAEELESVNQRLSAIGSSEESPHSGFPIVETSAGTLMYHLKDFCILSQVLSNPLKGIKRMRIDLCHIENPLIMTGKLVEVYRQKANVEDWLAEYPNKRTMGYFKTNRSNVLFKKLKNTKQVDDSLTQLGEVIEVLKGRFLVVQAHGNLVFSENRFVIKTTLGETIILDLPDVFDSQQNRIEAIDGEKIVLIPFRGKVFVKSRIYLSPKESGE